MPDLIHLLQSQDLGYLRIVAELWGVELRSNEVAPASRELAAALIDPKLAAESIDALPPDVRRPLTALAQAGGRLPWASFARDFGDVPEMGAGRRDREKPYLRPSSAAEALYYRALLGRAFFDTDNGPQEFAYLPDEWLLFLQARAQATPPAASHLFGRPAVPAERAHVLPANDRLLDAATTFLAALRVGRSPQSDPLLESLLHEAGLLKNRRPQAEKVKAFLEAPRPKALSLLVEAWRLSGRFNELRLVPGLICEGEWDNQPKAARQFLLRLLDALPSHTWWSLDAFIGDVKSTHPDFQRPAGDYDSWFIKDAADGRYLRGFAEWDRVDGALIRFLITDVMHRLGILDLAGPAVDAAPSAFRFAAPQERPQDFPGAEKGKLHVSTQAKIAAPRGVPRAVRYQLARFCEWEEERADEYRYLITPASLARAAEQGLKVEQLLALLAKHADAGSPAALVKALKRWEAHGTEGRVEEQVILRVSRPEILRELRKSKAARFLGEPLGPTAILVKRGAQSKVIAALAELSILAADGTSDSQAGPS